MIAAVDFVDLKDKNYLYHAGDKFPRTGAVVSDARIAELSGADNKLGMPVIKAQDVAEQETFPMNPPEETHEVAQEATPRKRRRKNAD